MLYFALKVGIANNYQTSEIISATGYNCNFQEYMHRR